MTAKGAAQRRFATYYSVASHAEAHHSQAINWVTIRSESARATDELRLDR